MIFKEETSIFNRLVESLLDDLQPAEKIISEGTNIVKMFTKDVERYDCGCISSFRGRLLTPEEKKKYEIKTTDSNLSIILRNKRSFKELAKDLRERGLSYTKVDGRYVYQSSEEQSEMGEDGELTYFVRDTRTFENGDFKDANISLKDILIMLGEKYGQESILFIPKNEKPYFIWTDSSSEKYQVGQEGKRGTNETLQALKNNGRSSKRGSSIFSKEEWHGKEQKGKRQKAIEEIKKQKHLDLVQRGKRDGFEVEEYREPKKKELERRSKEDMEKRSGATFKKNRGVSLDVPLF